MSDRRPRRDSLDDFLEIFTFGRKADLKKHCRVAVIYKSDFANFIMACKAGAIPPWRHIMSSRNFTPDHLHLTEDDVRAMAGAKVGPLEGAAKKTMNKVEQTFEQRRLLIGHLFFNADDLSEWHFFYFDQRDTSKHGNHWAAGSHIHLINCVLRPDTDAEAMWTEFNSGNIRLHGSLHIRSSDEMTEADRRLMRDLQQPTNDR